MDKVDFDEKKEYIEYWLSQNSSTEYYKEYMALEYSCKRGYFDVVQKLVQNDIECTETAIAYSAGSGHLEVFVWLYHNANKVDLKLAIQLAVFHGQIKIIEWIKENTDEKIDFQALLPYSVKSATPEIWKVLYEYQYGDFTEEDYLNSVKQGYNNVVKQVYHNFKDNAKLQAKAYKIARQQNNPELMEFYKNSNKTKFREILDIFFNLTRI